MLMVTVFGIGVLYAPWILLAVSLAATAVHGGQELAGWRGQRSWWLFLAAQSSFVVLAVGGLACGVTPLVGLLVACRLVDGIGFHILWFPQWPGRETVLLPLADAALLALWLVA